MSSPNKPSNEPTKAETAEDEVTEDDLEAVSGGILIGLNQPSLAGHKDSVTFKDHKQSLGSVGQTAPVTDAVFKFIK